MASGDYIGVLAYQLWLTPLQVQFGGQVMVQANGSSGGEKLLSLSMNFKCVERARLA